MLQIKQMGKSKEGFCPACLLTPLSLSGVGTSMYGNKYFINLTYKQKKKRMLIIGTLVPILSLSIILYFFNECSDCR